MPPRPQPAPDVETLPRIDGFSVLRRLDAGGMGVVYLAETARGADAGRRVALKMVDERVGSDDVTLRRFAYEGRWTRELDHPHVLPIREVVEHDGATVLVMDYVPGRTLAHLCAGVEGPRLPSGERLVPRRLVELVADVADGLHHAHSKGIVHRDVKPANILVRDDGHPFLIDFGIARHLHLDASTELTRTGQVLGTPQYMAPEQIGAEHDAVDARTDVYGLAVSLYTALAGAPPFVEADLARLARAVREDEPPRLPPGEGLPDGLDAVLRRALEKSPRHRYPTAAAFADDLRRVAAGVRPHASVASLWMRRRWRQVQRHRAGVAAAALAAVALCLAGALDDQRDLTEAQRVLAGAREALDDGALERAVALCTEAARLDPDDPEPWRVLASAWVAHERYRHAREALDEARARGDAPRDGPGATGADLAALALVDLHERRIEAAVDRLGRAVAREPELFGAWDMLAGQLALLERDAQAREAFARYRQDLEPRHPRRVVVDARLAQLEGREADAVALLEEHVARRPERADALARALGQAYLRLSVARGHRDRSLLEPARGAFLRATAVAPSDLTSWINLGRVGLLLGDVATARLCARRATAFDVELPSAHALAAHLRAHEARSERELLEADRALHEALALPGAWRGALDAMGADVAFRRSQLLRARGRYADERTALGHALEHAPDHPAALMMLTFVEWYAGEHARALATSERALDALAASPGDAPWRRLARADELLADALVARLDAAARAGDAARAGRAADRLHALDADGPLRPRTALNLAEVLAAHDPERHAGWVRSLLDEHALWAAFGEHPQARPILQAIERRLGEAGGRGAETLGHRGA